MKTGTLIKYLLVVSGILFGKLSSFGGTKQDSLYFVEVKGNVMMSHSDTTKTYKIELFCQNEIVESGVGVDNESFLIRLKKDSQYTIRITKPGYLPFVMSINTHLSDNNSNKQKYDFANSYFQNTHGFTMLMALNN